MPRLLLIKMSSLGDVVHTFPALTDAMQAIPDLVVDWVVEEAFQEMPSWHPAVDKVIVCPFRRWRKSPLKAVLSGEWAEFKRQLADQQYDYVIDAQGLLKSAFVTRLASAPKYGFDKLSAREALASKVLDQGVSVAKGQHAVERTRQLFSGALNYELPKRIGNYNLNKALFENDQQEKNQKEAYVVFLHGTTWVTKHWPEQYWCDLAREASRSNVPVKLLWGSDDEKTRAEKIAKNYSNVTVMPKMNLREVSAFLANAKAVVSVDTGLGHLAAALDVPAVSLYGPTNSVMTGSYGEKQIHMQSAFNCAPCLKKTCPYSKSSAKINPPCFEELTPVRVWSELQKVMAS